MIIDSNNSVNSSATSSGRTRSVEQTNAKSTSPAKPASAETDNVSLSVKAQALGRLEAKIADTPEVDEAKVANIKAAISEGRYQVDSQTIAERLLSQDDLLG